MSVIIADSYETGEARGVTQGRWMAPLGVILKPEVKKVLVDFCHIKQQGGKVNGYLRECTEDKSVRITNSTFVVMLSKQRERTHRFTLVGVYESNRTCNKTIVHTNIKA